jgi:capsular exopolysaccharide synthesis family protein
MGAVLIAERVDPRVHTRENVELAFDLPVVAEVPRERGRGHHTITSVLEPLSASAEAHRSVRATVLLTPVSQLGRRRGRNKETVGEHAAEPQVLLVTSPAPGDGKTTTVANLAAVFAEMGRSVLLLGCDFRRPELHKYFGSPTHPGTSDVLTGTCTLADVVVPTNLEGVSIAPTGSGLRKLGDLAAAGVSLVESARELADVVIIDTAPMLATNDAAELVHAVDAVVLVARSGRTTTQSARRVRALLDRLSAPVVGVVLIGAPETESSYSAYSPYTVRSKPSRRRPMPRPPAPETADEPGGEEADDAVVPAPVQAQARPAPAPVKPPATVPETVLEPRRRLRSAPPPRPAG